MPSGTRSLTAFFPGAKSPAVLETVNTLAGNGFYPQVTYNVGFEPYALAVGDLNGDGRIDAVLPVQSISSGSWNQVAVLLGNGDGTFQSAQMTTAGTNIVAVAIGDFNGDGIPDLALADAGQDFDLNPTIDILLGNGDGTFRLGEAPFTNTDIPQSIVVGDFNGDGREDIAIATVCFGNTRDDVAVFFGNGDGSFQDPYYYATGSTLGANGLAVGDFNSDGYPDLAVAEDTLVILNGSPSGIFSIGSINPAGDAPSDVKTADFNHDGKADLAVANFFDANVGVFIGNGDGTFQPQVTYSTLSQKRHGFAGNRRFQRRWAARHRRRQLICEYRIFVFQRRFGQRIPECRERNVPNARQLSNRVRTLHYSGSRFKPDRAFPICSPKTTAMALPTAISAYCCRRPAYP